MTVGMAAGTANTSLDSIFATVWVKLHVGDPGASAASNAAAGDTTRKQATMGSASAGSKSMSSMSGSWTNVSTTETLSHLSLWTLVSAGTFMMSLALTGTQAWVNTNTFTLTSLVLSYSPIAA